ncbi:MAG: erythromycin esterase family protein [Pseudooceanicola sp.]
MALETRQSATDDTVALLEDRAERLPEPGSDGFAACCDRWAECRVVMLGDATHGTGEFYRARGEITRHLVARHGFDVLAFEADWPDMAALDRNVRHRAETTSAGAGFDRFPRWMWRNEEFAELVGWLRTWNEGRADRERAMLCGLDIYSLWASMDAVIAYLDRVDPDAASVARLRYGCLDPWAGDPAAYAGAMARGLSSCEDAIVDQCRELLEREIVLPEHDDLLDASQNARLVATAEAYYRGMYRGGARAWNLRDSHMFDTLKRVMEARGPDAKAVVWAHNSHVGDARATAMGREGGEHNIGQLARETFGDDVALIGFGTHDGTVAAASDWGGPMRIKEIRPSHPASLERLCHDTGATRFLLEPNGRPDLREALSRDRLERFIGVIYRPETELQSHYAEASLAAQFDGWIWLDRTHAVTPLDEAAGGAPSDTWPFGH